MSIQLASMPGSRLCVVHGKRHPYVSKASVTHKKKEEQEENSQEQQQTKPFLQSLFTSTPFMGLLNRADQESSSKPVESVPCTKEEDDHHHWSTDFWKLFSHFSNTHQAKEEEKEEEQVEFDEGYYQIDHDERNSMSDSCSEDSDGMLLAIPPLSVNLDHAVEYLHRAIVTQSISEEKMDTWCRSIFQSWEGIGNSFLCANKLDINLDELTRFYQLVIHQDRKSKNVRQVRIMEAMCDSFETLLDRMCLNVDGVTEMDETSHVRLMNEWCRSIMAVIQWIICCKENKYKEEQQDGLAALVAKLDDISTSQKRTASIASTSQIILMQKLIQVLSKLAQKKDSVIRKKLLNVLARLDSDRMNYLVQDLHQYLLDHYHTGPYKHGLEDTVIMTLKCLELLCRTKKKKFKFFNIYRLIYHSLL